MNWGMFFTVIATVAAALSAGVSLYQTIAHRNYEKEQQKMGNLISWYNKITLDTIVPMLNEMTDFADQKLDALNKGRLSDTDIEKVREVHKEVESKIRSVEEILRLLELFDKKVYKDTSRAVNEIREEYTKVFNKMSETKFGVYYDSRTIHREKKEVLKVLLDCVSRLIE